MTGRKGRLDAAVEVIRRILYIFINMSYINIDILVCIRNTCVFCFFVHIKLYVYIRIRTYYIYLI